MNNKHHSTGSHLLAALNWRLIRGFLKTIVPPPLKRLYWDNYHRFCPKIIDFEGLRVYGPSVRNFGGKFVKDLMLGIYEPSTTRLLKNELKPGMTFIDIGANVGLFTLLAARLVGPKGHVHAFEPAPENLRWLKENISLNPLKNVTPHSQAVSDCSGIANLRLGRESGLHSLLRPKVLTGRSVDVPTIRLDDFLDTVGKRLKRHVRPDFIKMDIEGAEPLALRGMQNLLKSPGPLRMVLELNPWFVPPGSPELATIKRLLYDGFQSFFFVDDTDADNPLKPVDLDTFEPLTFTNLYCVKH